MLSFAGRLGKKGSTGPSQTPGSTERRLWVHDRASYATVANFRMCGFQSLSHTRANGEVAPIADLRRALGGRLGFDPNPSCLSRIEKSQFLTDRDVAESAAGCRAGRQQFIDLMVERAAAGEAPSSPQPPEAGARRARLCGASSAAENRTDRQCRRAGVNVATGAGSADFEHVADLPPATGRGPAASFRAFELALADMREDGAEVLVLDDGGLRNLPQLVEGGVWQVEPSVADRQPPSG